MRVTENGGRLGESWPRHKGEVAQPPTPREPPDLNGTRARDRALPPIPAIRTEEIARAKALIADPIYPSPTVLQAVAARLSRHLRGERT